MKELTIRQLNNRMAKMFNENEKTFTLCLDDYDRYVAKKNEKAAERIAKRVAKYGMTLADFIRWAETDTRN